MTQLCEPTGKKGLTPLTKRRADLRKVVEEAEWLGDTARLEAAEEQLFWVEDQLVKGYLYEPNF